MNELSLIRTGTLEEFHSWFYSLKDNIYDLYIAKDPTDIPNHSICLYIPPDVASFRPWVHTITSTLGQYPRIVWICYPDNSHRYGCGCIHEWSIWCESHGGPLSELKRASSAYLENVGDNRKSNLIMLHRSAGQNASTSWLYSQLCLYTFDMILYTEPTTEEWIQLVCKQIIGKQYEQLDKSVFT